MKDADVAEKFKREFFWTAFRALEFNGISGDYAEFGCHGARTFRMAAEQIGRRGTRRHLWAFDSFLGLPDNLDARDEHPRWTKGKMMTTRPAFEATLAEAGIGPKRYTVVEGYYSDTLVRTDIAFPEDIALAYIDCDLYTSTRDVLDWLAPRLKHGMILAFDDYFCWSATQVSGERAAFAEFRDAQPRWGFHRYRDYGWAGCSYVVEARG